MNERELGRYGFDSHEMSNRTIPRSELQMQDCEALEDMADVDDGIAAILEGDA